MVFEFKKNIVTFFVITYFLNAVVEIVAEIYSLQNVIIVTKPLIPFLLMVLYFFNSKEKNTLFYFLMFFSALTNILFIPNASNSLFYGVIAYTIHRIILLIIIFRIVKIKDFIPFILATLPLCFIFFYLFTAADIPENTYFLVIFHNIIAAVLGGFAISSYILNDNKLNSFLLISVLLFLGLQLVIYIEKYYLVESHSRILRPLAMTLNVFAFYMFYKFMICSENQLNSN